MAVKNISEDVDTRTRLVEATIDALSKKPHSSIRFNDMCAELGVQASLVQYYFGGRDGLISEAVVVAYERYVAGNSQAAKSAKNDPESRLRAWIWSQYQWTVANPGIASLLNFGMFVDMVDTDVSAEQLQRFETAGVRNMAIVGQLVHDLRHNTVSDRIAPDLGSDPVDAKMTALVTWTTLGFSTWASGHHLPTRKLAGLANERKAVEAVVDELIADVKRNAPHH